MVQNLSLGVNPKTCLAALTWYKSRLLVRHVECESLLARGCQQKNISTTQGRSKLRHPRHPAPAFFPTANPVSKGIPTKELMAALKAPCICPKDRAGSWSAIVHMCSVPGHHFKWRPVTVSRDLSRESAPHFTQRKGTKTRCML